MGGNEVFHGIQHKSIVTGLEPASFEVERFELGRDACLEVHGRWFGVRGRRFLRPTLTAVADGREQRSLAVLDHKPWIAEEGEAWLAAFPWSTDPAALLQAELTVAPDVTVPLPPPSSPAGGRRRRAGSARTALRSSEQALSERDAARAERAEAVRERDEAHGERDAARRERNRMFAQRDTARSRADETTRQWEVTAALGTRRTQERDAALEERYAVHEQTLVRAESAVAQRDPEAPVRLGRAPRSPRAQTLRAARGGTRRRSKQPVNRSGQGKRQPYGARESLPLGRCSSHSSS
jgi:hypothetical protein